MRILGGLCSQISQFFNAIGQRLSNLASRVSAVFKKNAPNPANDLSRAADLTKLSMNLVGQGQLRAADRTLVAASRVLDRYESGLYKRHATVMANFYLQAKKAEQVQDLLLGGQNGHDDEVEALLGNLQKRQDREFMARSPKAPTRKP